MTQIFPIRNDNGNRPEATNKKQMYLLNLEQTFKSNVAQERTQEEEEEIQSEKEIAETNICR